MKPTPEQFAEVAQREVQNTEQVQFFVQVGAVFKYLCDTSLLTLEDPLKAKEQGALIRGNSLENLASLLEEFEQKATQNGIKVLWAVDAIEANNMVLDLVKKYNVKTITKGKSMISEEIAINDFLEKEAEVDIFEGDLGELIVQKRGTPPFHIVGPAINLKVQEIAQILVDNTGMEYTEEAIEIASHVRNFMRDKFIQADMSITGVNMAIAETGSLLLVENEGNIRWCTSTPPVHVALMSLEKVVKNITDAFHLLELLTRSCTGQAITSYISLLNGPKKENEKDGPQEVYLIIIDNGRSNIYQDEELRDALRCIRCGRCGITCPIYLHIGAYPYGWCYPGPMGVMLTPLLLGIDKTRKLFDACTLCGECQAVCPSGVPHIDLYHHYREMKVKGNEKYSASPVSGLERTFFKLWATGMMSPLLFNIGISFARRYLNKFEKNGYISSANGIANGWFEIRYLPAIPEKSFNAVFKEMKEKGLLNSSMKESGGGNNG